MNTYPPEQATQEEQQPLAAPEQPPAPPRHRPPARWDRNPSVISIFTLICSILALIAAGTALFLVLRGNQEADEPPAPPEEPATFRFGDRTLVPLEGMPVNPYTRESFSLDSRGRVQYEKDGKKGRTGIDVSTYQNEIDWQAVAADGIDFAILRLGYRGYTEGGLFMDQSFAQNLQGALDAGLEVGVYFFSQAITPEEAEAEAAYILNAIAGRSISYPIAFDWETITPGSGARTDGLDSETLTRCAAAFCEKIKAAGYTPAVYFNQTLGYLHYDLRELTDYALWLAEYDSKPDFYYHFDLWQYSHTGQVAGIEGDVDLDLDLR